MAKILVVDDDDMIRKLLKTFFTGKGYEVLTAASGGEALAKIKEGPAIVLLDISMPGMDGLSVLDRIKETAPATEVIMVTGLSENAVALESIRRGAFEYITKPIDLAQLEFLVSFKITQMGIE
ncbi:MAG: response regulator [Desulfobacterales bacterium]|nr:response regulator [Desulfobacterales bacterium]